MRRTESGLLARTVRSLATVKLPRRVAALCAVLAFGGCLWRPPIIPPLASPDGSTQGTQDSGVRADSGAWADSSAPLTDREACDRAAAANDGAVPEVVSNNGRDVACAPYYADASSSDASPSPDAADAQSSDSGEGGVHIERHDGGETVDADASDDARATDDGGEDAGSDAANG